jgi:hypothetical protein
MAFRQRSPRAQNQVFDKNSRAASVLHFNKHRTAEYYRPFVSTNKLKRKKKADCKPVLVIVGLAIMKPVNESRAITDSRSLVHYRVAMGRESPTHPAAAESLSSGR